MVTAIDSNTALILIDLQKGIVQNTFVHPTRQVLGNAAKLVTAFRKAGKPIVIVNVNLAFGKFGNIRKDAPANAPAPAKDAFEIVPEIEVNDADIYITKHTWGAFFETELHNELQSRNITAIVIAGIATSMGVEGTARQAAERGYNIAFATDAITDRVEAVHENSLKNIFPKLGEVDTTENIITKMG